MEEWVKVEHFLPDDLAHFMLMGKRQFRQVMILKPSQVRPRKDNSILSMLQTYQVLLSTENSGRFVLPES